MLTLEDFLRQLEEDCQFSLTDEQLFHIRYAMAHYALAVIDGDVAASDATEIALEELVHGRNGNVEIS